MGSKKFARRIENAVHDGLIRGYSDLLRDKHIVTKKLRRRHPIDYSTVVAAMLGDLYNNLSGTSSLGEDYTFKIGKDAALLSKIHHEILVEHKIDRKDVLVVYEIYKKYFPEKAEQYINSYPLKK